MLPKRTTRTARTARVAAATATTAAAATPMTTAAIEQLVADRVSAALANHDTLRNMAMEATILALEPEELRALRKAVTQEVAYAMDWKLLKKLMTVKYFLRGEIKKLEIELWNPSYTLHFKNLH
ncbi:hypothetical protein Tco_0101589 [Tanacetum coccineum]